MTQGSHMSNFHRVTQYGSKIRHTTVTGVTCDTACCQLWQIHRVILWHPPAVVGISPNHSSSFKSQPSWMKYISLERKNSDLQDGATRFVILFVKLSYTPLERKFSDLQDGATRFVILLLVVCKIKLYTMGKENLDPKDDIQLWTTKVNNFS